MTEDEYLDLYEKHQAGTATPAERARFEAYLGAADLPDLPWQEAEHGDEATTQAAIFQHLRQSGVPAPTRRRRQSWAALLAFVVVLVAGVGGYWGWQYQAAPTVAQRPARPAAPAVLHPGRNQAVLTLADGSTVLLDQARQGLLARQGGSQVQKTADGATPPGPLAPRRSITP
jgi:transmembrane sensor